jgi:hypothetical protein
MRLELQCSAVFGDVRQRGRQRGRCILRLLAISPPGPSPSTKPSRPGRYVPGRLPDRTPERGRSGGFPRTTKPQAGKPISGGCPSAWDQNQERVAPPEFTRDGERSRASGPIRYLGEVDGGRSGRKVGEPEASGGNSMLPLRHCQERALREDPGSIARGGIGGTVQLRARPA